MDTERLEEFVPENLRAAPARRPKRLRLLIVFGAAGAVILGLVVSGLIGGLPGTGIEAWSAGRERLLKQFPLGTQVERPGYAQSFRHDPWRIWEDSSFSCTYQITEPGKQPYDLRLSMKKGLLGWRVER